MMSMLLGLVACLALAAASLSSHHSAQISSSKNLEIDEQLYSRQLLVYGSGAQQALTNASVLVFGDGPLAAEVVKNLALAGVGHLFVIDDHHTAALRLKGDAPSLTSYAHELNPHIYVTAVTREHALEGAQYTVVVCTDIHLAALLRVNAFCRDRGIKVVGCNVLGVCGFVFSDLLKGFKVWDALGEAAVKEVPVSRAEWLSGKTGDTSAASGSELLRLVSIEEEQFGYGIDDDIDLCAHSGMGVAAAREPVRVEVVHVDSTRSVVVRAGRPAALHDLLSSGRGGDLALTAKKLPRTRTVDHRSLNDYLTPSPSSPVTFNPCNGCLSDRQNRALSLTLAAAFLASSEEQELGNDGGGGSTKEEEGEWPRVRSEESFRDAVLQHLLSLGVSSPLHPLKQGGVGDALDRVVPRLYRSRRGRCPGAVSVVGAVASQEAIKAVTGVHTPLQQALFFESLDSLPTPVEEEDYPTEDEEASNMELVYGRRLARAVTRQRLFLVGAGAIGCELLKNFALMNIASGNAGSDNGTELVTEEADDREDDEEGGSGSGEEEEDDDEDTADDDDNLWARKGLSSGGIIVADMDSIEKSNLNRQLLFRPRHIGASKAETAAVSVRVINPAMRVWGVNSKVAADVRLFDGAFWGGASLVTTALDNVEARRHVDAMCVRHGLCLLDSGTQGTRGNTQVVLPRLSESYSASSDPVDDAIPLCTLKSFPYQAEHCVAWAKALFEAHFDTDIAVLQGALQTAVDSRGDPAALAAFADTLTEEEQARLLRNLDLFRGGGSSGGSSLGAANIDGVVAWAVELFEALFLREVERLVAQHPRDEVDEQGERFWSGSRKFPAAVRFDEGLEEHIAFATWAVALKCRALGLAWADTDREQLLARRLETPEPAVVEEELRSGAGGGGGGVALVVSSLQDIRQQLGDAAMASVARSLSRQSFEKDDPALGHVDFVAAAANTRCRLYGIRPVDRLEALRIAGNIIPALATTTALVAGLVCLELMKVVAHTTTSTSTSSSRSWGQAIDAGEQQEGDALGVFRNSFVNLALPVLSFAQPVPAETFALTHDGHTHLFSVWDTLSAPGGHDLDSLTVAALHNHLVDTYGAYVQSVSAGDVLLYADFMPDANERLEMSLRTLLSLGGADLTEEEGFADDRAGRSPSFLPELPTRGFLDVEAACVDAEGEDVRLPLVRVPCCAPADLSDPTSDPQRIGSSSSTARRAFKSLFTRAKKAASKLLVKKQR